MNPGLSGKLGGLPAHLHRTAPGPLILAVGDHEFDLSRCGIDHRDVGGDVTLTLRPPRAEPVVICYPRPGMSSEDARLAQWDFMEDEPWTWEDSDLGLRAFKIVWGLGPIKYRHAVLPHGEEWYPGAAPNVQIADDAFIKRRPVAAGGQTVHVPWDAITELRLKFDLSGIWGEKTMLVVWTADGCAAACPLAFPGVAAALPRLPDWDAFARAALADGLEYEARDPIGPRTPEELPSRAERQLWQRD